MGTEFMSKAEAAQVLGVHERTIYNYLRKGILRPVASGRTIGVSREDVSRRVGDKNSPLPFTASKAFLSQLLARVTRLEQRVLTLEHILSVKRDPLRLSDAELLALHGAAEEYGKEGWPAPVEETWGSIFLRADTDHFERLEALTGDRHAWRPFYRLAAKMARRPRRPDNQDLLTAGRSKLREVVTIWCILHGESPSGTEQMLREAAGGGTRGAEQNGEDATVISQAGAARGGG